MKVQSILYKFQVKVVKIVHHFFNTKLLMIIKFISLFCLINCEDRMILDFEVIISVSAFTFCVLKLRIFAHFIFTILVTLQVKF